MTGTAAHVTPIISIDHRPVGTGAAGPISLKLQRLYFAACLGELEKYQSWTTPVVYSQLAASNRT